MAKRFFRPACERAALFMALAASVLANLPASAVVIHESALPGATGETNGYLIDGTQFLGSRFSIGDTYLVDSIGGHLGAFGEGQIFGAILSLSSATALPAGSPFLAEELVATTTFDAPSPSEDFLTPLPAKLTPGNYALVFGSSLFGASGGAFLPFNNSDIPGSASYFYWYGDGSAWIDRAFSRTRFVVTGHVVPIPAAFWLLGSALTGLIGFRRFVTWRNDA